MHSVRDPTLGMGVIRLIDIDEMIIYIGKNEWIHDRVIYAVVAFKTCEKNLKFDDLIHASQVDLYNSLNTGDLIIHGKKKNSPALVVGTTFNKRLHNKVIKQNVWVLENGIKRLLHVKSDIIEVQKANDV